MNKEMFVKYVYLAAAVFMVLFTAVTLIYVFWVEPPSSPPRDARPVMAVERDW